MKSRRKWSWVSKYGSEVKPERIVPQIDIQTELLLQVNYKERNSQMLKTNLGFNQQMIRIFLWVVSTQNSQFLDCPWSNIKLPYMTMKPQIAGMVHELRLTNPARWRAKVI